MFKVVPSYIRWLDATSGGFCHGTFRNVIKYMKTHDCYKESRSSGGPGMNGLIPVNDPRSKRMGIRLIQFAAGPGVVC